MQASVILEKAEVTTVTSGVKESRNYMFVNAGLILLGIQRRERETTEQKTAVLKLL